MSYRVVKRVEWATVVGFKKYVDCEGQALGNRYKTVFFRNLQSL